MSAPAPCSRPFIRGLNTFGVRLPHIPEPLSFLLRCRWNANVHTADLIALLQQDRDLFVALTWLQLGPSDETCPTVSRQQATTLVASLTPELARYAVLGFTLFRSLRLGRSRHFPYDEFWTEALAWGIAARALSESVGPRCKVTAFFEALLGSVGEAALVASDPEIYDSLTPNGRQLPEHELQAHFGIDVHTVTWTLLRDLGFPRPMYQRALVESRKLRNATAPACPKGSAGLLDLSEIVGRIIAGDAAERCSLWPDFVAKRNDMEMGRDELNTVCDGIVNDWWDWGDLLSLPVRTLPGFATLSDWNERGGTPKRFNPSEGKPRVPRDQTKGLDILFVENDAMARLRVTRMLKNAGHSVRTAQNGSEALARIAESPPQIVLADWHMAHMDGLELCEHLRRTELGKRIFFILLVGTESSEALIGAYKIGINDFVRKGAPLDVLRARVCAAHKFIDQWALVDGDRRVIRNHCEESRRIAAEMKDDSLTDALTELPNRRYAMDRLGEEWLRTKRNGDTLSVIMLDIDFFKKVNDKYGHDVGDVVLRETAAILQSVTRRNEKACRIGGEEFLVICSESSLAEAASCAERVRASIEAHRIQWGLFDDGVTVSLGVAERSAECANHEDLIKRADEAIYAAKESGRNCVVLAPDNRVARFVGERLAG